MKPRKKGDIDFDSILTRSSQTFFRKDSDGRTLIISLGQEEHYFVLQGLAAEIWAALDGKKSLQNIRDRMIRAKGLPAARFDKDMQKLFRDLSRENLVTDVGTQNPKAVRRLKK